MMMCKMEQLDIIKILKSYEEGVCLSLFAFDSLLYYLFAVSLPELCNLEYFLKLL